MKKGDMHKVINRRKLISYIIVAIVLLSILLTFYGMNYYRNRFVNIGINSEEDIELFTEHFALILEDIDSPFGEYIYEGAKAKGEELGIYIENFGKNLPFSYSVKERLKMAIASGVNGIIIQASNDEEMVDLINQASSSGIPVITVLDDAPLSERICFVGVNQYQLGKYYGNQILKNKDREDAAIKTVIVLLDMNKTDKSLDLTFSAIKDTLSTSDIQVVASTIDRQSPFSSEETIHKIIMDEDNGPDIIICLNSADTISAYQTLVDYNKVGEIDIIGYYNQDIIESAIHKNIIDSTIVIDTKQMGEYSVEALNEYLTRGMVSEYISIDIDILE